MRPIPFRYCECGRPIYIRLPRCSACEAKLRRREHLGVICWSSAIALLCFALWSAGR